MQTEGRVKGVSLIILTSSVLIAHYSLLIPYSAHLGLPLRQLRGDYRCYSVLSSQPTKKEGADHPDHGTKNKK